jgi:hypothetical protein
MTSLGELGARLSDLREVMTQLRLTLVEDRPSDIALADGMARVVDDIDGWISECERALREGPSTTRTSADLEGIVQALSECKYCASNILRQFTQEVGARQRIDHVTAVGRERGGAWTGWATEVKRGVDLGSAALHELIDALLDVYQEIAERIGATSVSTQATSVGVHIAPPSDLPVSRSSQGPVRESRGG